MSRSRKPSRRRRRGVVADPTPAHRPRGLVGKTSGELDAMAAAGGVLAEVLAELASAAQAGITTAELDGLAEEAVRSRGATPAFKGFRGYPATITTSVNAQVVHAIPGPVVLVAGDLLSIDCGVVLDGWVADSARTVAIGEVTRLAARLCEATEASLWRGIEACRLGNHLGDIGHAIEREISAAGFSVVRSLVGHGIGRSMHEEPQVPNYGAPGAGPELIEGLTIAIEPMVNVGGHDVELGPDGWTVTSSDGSLSAHFEHTVAVTAGGPRVLTAPAAVLAG